VKPGFLDLTSANTKEIPGFLEEADGEIGEVGRFLCFSA